MRFACAALLVAVWLCGLGATPNRVQNGPTQLRIDPPIAVRNGGEYHVEVLAAGRAVFIVPALGTSALTLLVNGRVVQDVGSGKTPIGRRPFGQELPLLEASGLVPGDNVVVRTFGSAAPLTVVSELSLLSAAANIGIFTGVHFAFVFLIALFHLALFATRRERTAIWYAGYLLSVLWLDLVFDGVFGTGTPALVMLAVVSSIIPVFITGFVIAYLRLWRQARPLFWFVMSASIVSWIALQYVTGVRHEGMGPLFICDALFSLTPMLIAAIARARAGFAPAVPFIAGLLGLILTWTVELVLQAAGADSSALDIWGGQVATMVDAVLFAFAIAVRGRFTLDETARLETELRRSIHDATHDPLTGLLNRRGLDEWLLGAGEAVSTIFFIDLDGFKAVNDRGGHAAGDDVLRVVSKILQRNVRENDAVARVGGDEFVVALSDAPSGSELELLRCRIAAAIDALEPLGGLDATRIGASIGVAAVESGPSIDAALQNADADAYRIKAANYALRRSRDTTVAP